MIRTSEKPVPDNYITIAGTVTTGIVVERMKVVRVDPTGLAARAYQETAPIRMTSKVETQVIIGVTMDTL